MQYNIGMTDQNAEGLDLNRHKNESLPKYLTRVL